MTVAVAGAGYYVAEWWKAGAEPFSMGKLVKRSIEGAMLWELMVGIDYFVGPILTGLGMPLPQGIPGRAVKTVDPWLDRLLGLDRESAPIPFEYGQGSPTAND